MNLESRHLRHLAAIGRNGTFIRAAKALQISQPALTLSIQRLEDITKMRLVERGRSGASLTTAGQILARRGNEVDVTISAAAKEIELLSRGISGHLRVGGTPLSTNSIIPAVIGLILQKTRDVAIDVVEGIDQELLDLLSRNELDVVISAPGTAGARPPFKNVKLFNARTVIVLRPNHPLASKKHASLASLDDEIWVMPPEGGAFRKQIEAMFTTNGIPFPERIIQAASFAVLMRIVRSSDAISLASEQIIRDEMELGRLSCIEISDPVAARVFGLHTRIDRQLNSLGELFCATAVEVAPKFQAQSVCRP